MSSVLIQRHACSQPGNLGLTMLPGPCTAWSHGFTGDTALPPSLLMLVINNNRTVSQCHKLGLTDKLCRLTDRPQEVQNAIIIKINILEGIFLPTRSSQTLSVTRGVTSAEIRVWLSIHQQGTSRPKCPAQWELSLSLSVSNLFLSGKTHRLSFYILWTIHHCCHQLSPSLSQCLS